MKLFDYVYHNDYGAEHYFQLLAHYPKFALIDCRVQWDEFPATEWFPSIMIGIGPYDVFGFSIRYKWFEFAFSFMTFKPRNLEWYREDHERYEDID
jgi:hypothetical protein